MFILFLRFSCTFGVPKWLPRHILCPNVTEIVDACYMVQRYATQCYKIEEEIGENLQKKNEDKKSV